MHGWMIQAARTFDSQKHYSGLFYLYGGALGTDPVLDRLGVDAIGLWPSGLLGSTRLHSLMSVGQTGNACSGEVEHGGK